MSGSYGRSSPEALGERARRPSARAHPRRRVRRAGRGARAAQGRRRRRPRRSARLPHLPAAPVPAGDGPPRAERRRSLAPRPRPPPPPGERHRPQDTGDRDRPRGTRGDSRGHGAPDLRLSRARARRRGHVLRDPGGRRARLPDVHPHRRDPVEGARAREVGSGRQGPGPDRGRRAQHRRRRRRADRGRKRRGDRRALSQRLRQGLPGRSTGEGADRPGRGGAGRLRDVQAEPPHLHERRSRSARSRSSPGRASRRSRPRASR